MAIRARPELVFTDLQATSRDQVLRDLAQAIAAQGGLIRAAELAQGLIAREQLGTTAIGGGVAIPHTKLSGLRLPILAVAVLPTGLAYDAPDGAPVRLLFVVVSPAEAPAEHLRLLASISRWLGPGARRGDALLAADSSAEICELLNGEVQ